MALSPGTQLGVYEVTAKIGEGGMGDVYQARDTKLDRDVALKVLPEAFTADPDRLARFEREAKVLASLNHPNIATIHGLEDSGDVRALVLELVEGPTLADRIAQGAMPIDDALPIAKQIAEALEAAHEQGVIHRDLKPANIKVKTDGTVKVLDFGLAKAFQPEAGDPNMSLSPTVSLSAAATQMGMVIGTAAYMAPEQASGKIVDKRSDVWAFGVVLHEMLTGQRLFGGEDVSHTLAYVLTQEIDWSSLAGDTPDSLRRLLRRCLERNPRQRMRDIGDARIELDEPQLPPTTRPTDLVTPPAPRIWQRPVVIAGAVLVALAAGAVASRLFWATGLPSPEVRRFPVTLPDTDAFPPPGFGRVALSPDGRTLVYRAQRDGVSQLFRQPIDQFEATTMPGIRSNGEPFFSPDGQWLGFLMDRVLQKVALAGGRPEPLTTLVSGMRGAHWGADDLIVYGLGEPGGALMQIPADGGKEPTTLFTPDDQRRAGEPQVLPGSDAVLFTLSGNAADTGELHLLDRETRADRLLLRNAAAGRVLPTGHLVFERGGAVWAVPFDHASLDIVGTPGLVVEGVHVDPLGQVPYATADDGSLVYIPGIAPTGLRLPVWVDREGQEEVLALPPRDYETLSLSPGGTRAAIVAGRNRGNTDIFIADLARGSLSQLTTQPGDDTTPLWSPDGQRVAYTSVEDGRVTVYVQAVDGTGSPERLLTDETMTDVVPYDWSSDGGTLFLTAEFPGTGRDVGRVSTDGSGTWEPLVETDDDDQSPALSPDGRWLAYASFESGRSEVFVARYPEMLGQQLVSDGGGYRPHWSEDGRELFYLRATGEPARAVVRVTVETIDGDPPVLDVGDEEELFDWRYHAQNSPMRYYDLHPDGQRFLMITTDRVEPRQINVVLNWFEEFERLVPVP